MDPGPSQGACDAPMLQQRLANGRLGKLWSDADRIPAWWRSAARGADPNDI